MKINATQRIIGISFTYYFCFLEEKITKWNAYFISQCKQKAGHFIKVDDTHCINSWCVTLPPFPAQNANPKPKIYKMKEGAPGLGND